MAALKVEKYFDGLVNGKIRLRPLPSALASVLRERLPYRINDAGINRAVELAQEKRAQSDSASGGAAMRPAPGGPPIPGATPPGAATRARQPDGTVRSRGTCPPPRPPAARDSAKR